jgi:hypothetical protein
MHKVAEFIARYPQAGAAIFAVIAGWGAWNTYKAGMHAQSIRCLVGESDRAASEALGG